MNIERPSTIGHRLLGRLAKATCPEHNHVTVTLRFDSSGPVDELRDRLQQACSASTGSVKALGASVQAVWWLSDGSIAEAGTNLRSNSVGFERYRLHDQRTVPVRLAMTTVPGFFLRRLPPAHVSVARKVDMDGSAGANAQVTPKTDDVLNDVSSNVSSDGQDTWSDLPVVTHQYLLSSESFQVTTGIVFEVGVSTAVAEDLRDTELAVSAASAQVPDLKTGAPVVASAPREYYMVARASPDLFAAAAAAGRAPLRTVATVLHNFLQVFSAKLKVQAK
jgi:hypothetical protein